KSDTVSYELSAMRSYSFLWQPGTYLLDPSLPNPPVPPVAPVSSKREVRAPVARTAAPEIETRRRVPATPPPPVEPEPENMPWDDEEDVALEDVALEVGDVE